MEYNTNWDINKYLIETEPDEDWELRKEFMTKNKNQYAEHFLVVCALAFVNVEFMGRRYGEMVMSKLDEMSEGFVEPYRERRRKLDRTFVSECNAAESISRNEIRK